MRKVLTFSVSEKENQKINKRIKEKGLTSKSEYFKYLLALDEDFISEEELLKEIKMGEKEYVEGKCKPIEMLKDIL